MIKINLLREAPGRKGGLKPSLSGGGLVLALVAVVLFGSVFGWYYLLASDLDSKRAEEQRLRQESAQLRQVRQQIEDQQRLKARLDERVALIQRLKNGQAEPLRLMNGLLSSLPDSPKIWLLGLSQRNNILSLEGRAVDVPAIADFITDLGSQPEIGQVDLEYWEEQEESIKFKLNCQIKK